MPIYLAPFAVKPWQSCSHLLPTRPGVQTIRAVTPMTTSAPTRNMMATPVAMNFHMSYSLASVVYQWRGGGVSLAVSHLTRHSRPLTHSAAIRSTSPPGSTTKPISVCERNPAHALNNSARYQRRFRPCTTEHRCPTHSPCRVPYGPRDITCRKSSWAAVDILIQMHSGCTATHRFPGTCPVSVEPSRPSQTLTA
jgi:hypothetical protein